MSNINKVPGGPARKIFKQRVSPKAQAGEGTIDKVRSLREKYRPGINLQSGEWTGGNPIGGNRRQNYERQVPVVVGRPDPHDQMFDIKKQYVGGQLIDPEDGVTNIAGKLGQAHFDESDKAYLLEKEKQAEEIEYKSFARSLFNLDDPATAALVAEKILPDLYKEQEAEIDKMAKIQARLAKIRMQGGWPRTADEVSLLFAIKKGYIQLPKGALWDFKNWHHADNMQRGIFNPLRYIAGTRQYSDVDSAFTGAGARVTMPLLPAAGRVAQ
jgi:hypothetical protein